LKKHKPWFDEACLKLVDQRKETRLQWLQDPTEIKWDNLNIVGHEGNSGNFIRKWVEIQIGLK
jgi:hypothetical protein